MEWLELDRPVLKHGIKVDLIGYPGAYSTQYLVDTQNVGLFEKSAVRDI